MKTLISVILLAAFLCNEVTSQPGVCFLPKQSGPCFAAFPRFHYNPLSGRCEEFIWGGCQPNGNNFPTREACLRRCGCRAPPNPGTCYAYFLRWFFNPFTGTCSQFVYGGCGGNDNNFMSSWSCYNTCAGFGY